MITVLGHQLCSLFPEKHYWLIYSLPVFLKFNEHLICAFDSADFALNWIQRLLWDSCWSSRGLYDKCTCHLYILWLVSACDLTSVLSKALVLSAYAIGGAGLGLVTRHISCFRRAPSCLTRLGLNSSNWCDDRQWWMMTIQGRWWMLDFLNFWIMLMP